MPKDIHVEPEKFAAELINRLEEVQKEREAEEKLEERLKRVRAVSNLLASCARLEFVCFVCSRKFSAAVEATWVTMFISCLWVPEGFLSLVRGCGCSLSSLVPLLSCPSQTL